MHTLQESRVTCPLSKTRQRKNTAKKKACRRADLLFLYVIKLGIGKLKR